MALAAAVGVRPHRLLQCLDRRPDPVGLLLQEPAESDTLRRFSNAHREPLAGLVFAGRNDQGLDRRVAAALSEREEQALKDTVMDSRRLAVHDIVGVAALWCRQLDTDKIVGDHLQTYLGAIAGEPLHATHDSERPQRFTLRANS